MRTHTLQHHTAFFRGVLLCQVTVKLAELQPVGVATVLQALLAITQAEAAQHGTARRTTRALHSHAAVATAHSTSSSSSSSSEGAADVHSAAEGSSVGLRQQRRLGQHSSGSSAAAAPRLRVSPSAAARAHIGLSAALSGTPGDSDSQLLLLLRQMGQHILSQLHTTSPQTLYNIIIALAGVGYYEPRLYNRLAAAAAAAVAAPQGTPTTTSSSSSSSGSNGGSRSSSQFEQQQQSGVVSCGVYSVRQAVQLLVSLSQHQQAPLQLWVLLLPGLVRGAAQLTAAQLNRLLTAAAATAAVAAPGAGQGCGGRGVRGWGPEQMHLLLQLAAAALQQQQQQQQLGAGLQERVNLAAACTSLLIAAAQLGTQSQQQQQQQQQQEQIAAAAAAASLSDVHYEVHSQTARLVNELAAAVVDGQQQQQQQQQAVPWRPLLQLLHTAVLLHTPTHQQRTADTPAVHTGGGSSSSSSGGGSSSCSGAVGDVPAWQPAVGPRVLQQLYTLVHDHPAHWASHHEPHDLVLLLQCATHPALHTAHLHSSKHTATSSSSGLIRLSDGYAEELLCCMPSCSVVVCVSVLQVLCGAWCQQQGGHRPYCHAGLVSAAAKQLQRKVLWATGPQLAAAVDALEGLQQQQHPLYRAALKLLGDMGGGAHYHHHQQQQQQQ